jgi:hypothetical protein
MEPGHSRGRCLRTRQGRRGLKHGSGRGAMLRVGTPGQSLERGKAGAPPSDPARGFAPGPQQRARPFAICPLVGVLRGPAVTYQRPRRPPQNTNQNERFQGTCPLAEFQEAAPLGGVRGEAPRRAALKRLHKGSPLEHCQSGSGLPPFIRGDCFADCRIAAQDPPAPRARRPHRGTSPRSIVPCSY